MVGWSNKFGARREPAVDSSSDESDEPADDDDDAMPDVNLPDGSADDF